MKHKLLCAVSVLPALLVVPAFAEETPYYIWMHPDIESYATINGDVNYILSGTAENPVEANIITGTAMRDHVTGDVNVNLDNIHQIAKDNPRESQFQETLVTGSLFLPSTGGYLSTSELGVQTGNTAAQQFIDGNLNLTVSNSEIDNSVIGIDFYANTSELTKSGIAGKTTVTVNNSNIKESVRGTNYRDMSRNEPKAEAGDIELNINDSVIGGEIISAGSHASAKNVVINVTGNTAVGYTSKDATEQVSGADGWIIAGANRKGATITSTQINLVPGVGNTINIAGDVHAGSRERTDKHNTDENSVIGDATLNMFSGTVNIGGDIRAYHVGGTKTMILENVTANIAGTVRELDALKIGSKAKLHLADLALAQDAVITNDGEMDLISTNALGADEHPLSLFGSGVYKVGENVTIANVTAKDATFTGHNLYVANDGALQVSNITYQSSTAANGGALNIISDEEDGYNAVTNIAGSTFTGNTAAELGGAIYNSETATLVLTGKNVFTGNTAAGLANDIHNDGTLTIASGETTIDGGITGDGTLTLANGAVLNVGTATIAQDSMELNGVVKATINGATDYAKLLGDVVFGEKSELNLAVSSQGTYKMFDNVSGDLNINAGNVFNAEYVDDQIVISTKSAAEIAENTGLEQNAATMLAGLTVAPTAALANVSLAAQDALANGRTDYVEQELAKLAPEDKPVAQAMAQSVQNQVMTLTASRMSGRNGGDAVLTGGGVWAQGLFNKSKLNNSFHGYTRGVAAGIDEIINHDFTLGLGYAYGDSDVHANSGRTTDISSNTLFLYAQYKPNQWFVNGMAQYTLATYKEHADVFGVEKSSKHDVDSFGGSLTTGYRFASGATPELGLRYMHVTQDDYVDSFGINVSADNTDLLTGVAGVKYVFDTFVTDTLLLKPELRAAATYDFISDKSNSTVVIPGAAGYVMDGDRLSRVGGEFGVGLTTVWCGIELTVGYDLNIHKNYTSQTGMIKARYEF